MASKGTTDQYHYTKEEIKLARSTFWKLKNQDPPKKTTIRILPYNSWAAVSAVMEYRTDGYDSVVGCTDESGTYIIKVFDSVLIDMKHSGLKPVKISIVISRLMNGKPVF
jgi:hypothetical protein